MATPTPTTPGPVHDHVLVRRTLEGGAACGRILVAEGADEKPQEGRVVAAGTGRLSEGGEKNPLDVRAGDRVWFGKDSGNEVTLDGKEYRIMKQEDVLGILAP
ncbi:MAG: co-chaperone GroES [Candidatus Rokubacteria bacterium]|nr:co-chaperone GroES [Candidatus Rokubacteria bacterium]